MTAAPAAPVALDVHALQVEGWADRGVGRYVAGYAAALAARGALAAALLAPELPPAAGLPNEVVAGGLARWDSAATCRSLTEGGRPIAYHLTAPFLHCEPGAPAGLGVVEHWARSGVARVALLHDLIPLRAPRHYLPGPGHEERYRARAAWVGGSDLLLANSDHTRAEAIDLLGCAPDRVVTVGAGVSPFFSPADTTDEELWRFHFPGLIGRPYIVTVGGSDARKGTDRAIAALGVLVGQGFDLRLLVVGHLDARWRADLAGTARACGVGGRVVLAGAVDDEVLRACYRRAVVSVMPSLAEGAGLPVLESAACGTPALASCTSALAETAATPDALFDPTDVESLVAAIAAAVSSPRRREAILAVQQARAAASTWGAVAARAVAAIDAIVLPAGGPGPARLAMVGWPPGEEEPLARLEQAWGGPLDLVAAPSASGTDARLASYDEAVYVWPSRPGPSWVKERAGRCAGWLWLPPGAAPSARWAEFVSRSKGIVVGSAADAAAVERALPPGAAHPPVLVVPYPDGDWAPLLVRGLRAAATLRADGAGDER